MSTQKASAQKERTTGRIWTEEEKDIVWEKVMQAKANDQPLTEAFRQVAKILPHRSEAAVGMLYYNVLRKEREEPPAPKPSPPASRELRLDPDLIAAFQGLPEYIQQVDQRIQLLEKAVAEPVSSVKGLEPLLKPMKRLSLTRCCHGARAGSSRPQGQNAEAREPLQTQQS